MVFGGKIAPTEVDAFIAYFNQNKEMLFQDRVPSSQIVVLFHDSLHMDKENEVQKILNKMKAAEKTDSPLVKKKRVAFQLDNYSLE